MAADPYDLERAGRTLRDSATVVSAKRRLGPLLEAVARDPFNSRARGQLRAFLGDPLAVASGAWVRLQREVASGGAASEGGLAASVDGGGESAAYLPPASEAGRR